EAFDLYVCTQLAPCLSPGDVVIMDNLNVHKSPRAAKALAERGAWRLLLPKYSPDLNPIEMAFSKLKTLLRKAKPGPPTTSGEPSAISATSSSPTNAGIISRPQDMSLINRPTL
ncbi:transposase, partial [Jiella sp. CQZ9-1]|nr:transposase [Jiella flava]